MKSVIIILIWLGLSCPLLLPRKDIFKNADFENFNALLIDVERDDDHELSKNLAKEFFVTTKEPHNCVFESLLKVITLKDARMYSNVSKCIPKYIKDPCITLMVMIEEEIDLDMKNIRLKDQPYFLLLKDRKLFEVQVYSQNIVEVSETVSAINRRTDFNGSVMRVVDYEEDDYQKYFLALMQNQLKFDIEKVEFKGYGSFSNDGWTGAINQLMNNEVDIGTLKFAHTLERVQVADAGFGLKMSHNHFFFDRNKAMKSSSYFAILQVFTDITWLVMGSTFATLCLSFLLFGKNTNFEMLISSFGALGKAFCAQSFDDSNSWNKNLKISKYILIFSVSLLGGFIYWYFTGLLVSFLTAPTSQPPITALNDLLAMSEFKLYIVKDWTQVTLVREWADRDPLNQRAYRSFVAPYIMNSSKDIHEVSKSMIYESDPNQAIMMSLDDFRKYSYGNPCDFSKALVTDLYGFQRGWMYPKNSFLTKIFDKKMKDLGEYGIIDKSLRRRKENSCQDDFPVVRFDFVTIFFLLLALGVILSLIILLFELLKKFSSQSKEYLPNSQETEENS